MAEDTTASAIAYREPKVVPADWVPNDDLYAEVMTRFGMTDDDVHAEVPAFHAYNAANGTLSQDWDQTFRLWCKRWCEGKQAPPRLEPTEAIAKKPEDARPPDYLEQSDQPLVVADDGGHRAESLVEDPGVITKHHLTRWLTATTSVLRCTNGQISRGTRARNGPIFRPAQRALVRRHARSHPMCWPGRRWLLPASVLSSMAGSPGRSGRRMLPGTCSLPWALPPMS